MERRFRYRFFVSNRKLSGATISLDSIVPEMQFCIERRGP